MLASSVGQRSTSNHFDTQEWLQHFLDYSGQSQGGGRDPEPGTVET